MTTNLARELQPTSPGPTPTTQVVLKGEKLRKSFAMGQELEILHGVSIELHEGELVALVGASGAGKSTLLHLLGTLERPTEGQVLVQGRDAWSIPLHERALLRNRTIGFVFQFYHLLPELSSVENALLPAMIGHGPAAYRRHKKALRERAVELLERFGMGSRLSHRPSQLSGGERQRVALARALFNDPAILLADEPTGNLDSATGEKVLELLFEEQARRGLAMILVTHDERIARMCQRVLYMEDGLIEADSSVIVPD